MAENRRYYQLDGENATAINVDHVLEDLTDILVDGPSQEEEIAVIRVPADPSAPSGSKAARDHFELGEVGKEPPTLIGEGSVTITSDSEHNTETISSPTLVEGSNIHLTPDVANNTVTVSADATVMPAINAAQKEIVVGTGAPANWGEGNVCDFVITTADQGAENLLGTDDDTKSVAFGTFALNQQNVPTLLNGFKAGDAAIADIYGNARLYMGENSRIAVHDNAWLDVTGEGTEVKFNSGSKVYIDSTFGANNIAVHGSWVTINDAKGPTWATAEVYFYVPKSEIPVGVEIDYEYIEKHPELIQIQYTNDKTYSTNYPDRHELDLVNTEEELLNLGYTYLLTKNKRETQRYIDGEWVDCIELEVKYRKTVLDIANDVYEDTKRGTPGVYYSINEDMPPESYDVPVIDITGAPHIHIQDYADVRIHNGAFVDMKENSQVRMINNSAVTIDDSYIVMEGSSGSYHPFIKMDDAYFTSGATGASQITIGFTNKDPQYYMNGNTDPLVQDMLFNKWDTQVAPFELRGDNNFGPYGWFYDMSVTTGTPYKTGWRNAYVDGTYTPLESLLPFFHLGCNAYINIDVPKGAFYDYEAKVKEGSNYIISSSIGNGSDFEISPVLGASSKFWARFGGDTGAQTFIEFYPEQGASTKVCFIPHGGSTTFDFKPASGTTTAIQVTSGPGSYFYYKLHMGMGSSGRINGTSLDTDRSGVIARHIEGIDTFKMENGYIHWEESDYSRFIMRGNNSINKNSDSVAYTEDITQFDGEGHKISTDKLHLHKDWSRPINNEDFDDSPTFQMYESSNLILRGWWKYPTLANVTIPFTTSTSPYSTSTEISLEEFKTYQDEYDDFLEEFSNNDKRFIGLTPGSKIYADDTNITVESARYELVDGIKYHPNAGLDSALTRNKRSSILEMTDNSELRLWDGICIYARYNPETNEPGIEIVNRYGKTGTDGSGAAGEIDRVEFTFDELKALKALLTQIPIQVVQSASEATEQGVMYFVDGGGN